MIAHSIAFLVFAFPGGSEYEFVDQLSRDSKRPVILMADGASRYVKATLEEEDETKLQRRIIKTFQLDGVFQDGWGVGAKAWPIKFVLKQNVQGYIDKFQNASKPVEFRRDSVTLSKLAKGEAYTLGELGDHEGKSISWHWFFEEARLLVSPGVIGREDLWTLIAAAVGAKLETNDKSIHLAVNPTVLRRRWANMVSLKPKTNLEHQIAVTSTALCLLSDGEIIQLYKNHELKHRLQVKAGTNLNRLCNDYVAFSIANDPAFKEYCNKHVDLKQGIELTISPVIPASVRLFSSDRKRRINF